MLLFFLQKLGCTCAGLWLEATKSDKHAKGGRQEEKKVLGLCF
jgi:hypothetical protein